MASILVSVVDQSDRLSERHFERDGVRLKQGPIQRFWRLGFVRMRMVAQGPDKHSQEGKQ